MIQICSTTALFGALFLASACTSAAHSAADIEIVSESGTSLSVKFTDAQNNNVTLSFGRPTTNDVWIAQSQTLTTGAPEIVFGNDDPTFAGPAALRAMGIHPGEAIRTFASAITQSEFDDITIYRLYGGESAIALWRETSISEIWYVGEMVKDFVIEPFAPSTCEQSLDFCCRHKQTNPPEGDPVTYPWPHINNCVAVIQSCGAGYSALACDCLFDACDFCAPEHPQPVCSEVPGLEDRSADACATHTSRCNPGPPDPDPAVKVINLLAVVLDRVQAIIDNLTPVGGGP